MEEVPSNYKTAGIMMLIAGIFNIIYGLSLTIIILVYVIASFGLMFPCLICCIWVPVPIGFGIYEIMNGMNAMNGKVVHNASTLSIVGIVLAAISFNVIPLVLEIISTVMLNDDEVKAWLAQHDPELLT